MKGNNAGELFFLRKRKANKCLLGFCVNGEDMEGAATLLGEGGFEYAKKEYYMQIRKTDTQAILSRAETFKKIAGLALQYWKE